MADPRITELAHLARSSPSEAVGLGERLLAEIGDDPTAEAMVERALCEATRLVRPIDESIAHGRRAVARARAAGDDDLGREASLTLSGSLHLSGDAAAALAAIAAAAEGATGVFAAKTDFQRATVLAREGHHDEALDGYRAALPVLEAAGETRFVALCHQNAGNVLLEAGDVTAALDRFTAAAELFRRLDLLMPVAMMEHNIGRAHGYAGRVAAALDHLARAEEQLEDLTAGSWEIKASKCELLLQAGLHADALALADRADTELEAAGLEMERAEAVLWRAVATLEIGDAAVAGELARKAAELFRRQQRGPWALQADALGVRCGLAAGSVPDVDRARRLAEDLGRAGQVLGAAWAWLAVAATEPAAALDGFTSLVPTVADAPLELRLAARQLEAEAHRHAGRIDQALEVTAAALIDGHRHRASLGSSDTIAGASAQLRRLARLGLEIRVDQGEPGPVVDWLEQTRSALTRPLPPTCRSARVDALAAELRIVHLETRTAGPGEVAALLGRQARLQQELTVADRASRRDAGDIGRAVPPDLASLAGRTVIHLAEVGGRLLAAVIDDDGPRLQWLGPVAEAAGALRRLVRVADRFAARPDERGRTRLVRAAAAAQELVLPTTVSAPTTIAPPALHLSVPWALLPALAEREVSVAPSLAPPPAPTGPAVPAGPADLSTDPIGGPGGGTGSGSGSRSGRGSEVGLVLGPDLHSGPDEVDRIAGLWAPSADLRGGDATIEATLALLGRVGLAHVAAHGHRSSSDGRFAGIRLVDGDLTTFDLEGLERAPVTVVFSGCDAGVLQPLAGGEAVGLAGALFQRGATTVVAATSPLPDDSTTSDLFVGLHRRLASGDDPATALAGARRRATDPVAAAVASLVTCFRLG
jgi:tetratricopeptide (TPR) repeat protein